MAEDAIEKSQWLSMLSPLVNKVPAKINSADVKTVRDWKALVVKARKAMESRKTTVSTLQNLFTQLSQYQ